MREVGGREGKWVWERGTRLTFYASLTFSSHSLVYGVSDGVDISEVTESFKLRQETDSPRYTEGAVLQWSSVK